MFVERMVGSQATLYLLVESLFRARGHVRSKG